MHEPNNYCSNLESDLWEQGFTTFPVNSDGKSGFLSGITGYKGSPPTDEHRATWKKDFPSRNIGMTGYIHKNGVRDETQFMLILDDDDETGEATKDLEDAIGEELPATVSVSGRGQSNPRKKTLYIVDGHRLRLPSKIMDGRIDIISDVQRLIVIGGTHSGTGLPIQIYGPSGEVLDRPLKVSDLARAPQALVEFLKSQVGNDFGPRETDENLTVDNFMACLDDREPSYFAAEFLDKISLNRNFGNSELYENLLMLVVHVNLSEKGTQAVFDRLHWCWHARDHVSGDAEKEWEHALTSAVRDNWHGHSGLVLDFTLREMVVGWLAQAEEKFFELDLEQKFFEIANGRPNFDHCGAVSAITGDRPIALAAAHLMQVNHEIPYNVKLKSSLGEESLNQILVVIGGTGTGKSAVLKNASSSLYWQYPRLRPYLGPTEPISGEGANMAFKTERKGKGGLPSTYLWRDEAHNQIFNIDEVGLLEARGSRQGSTMRETILIHHSCSDISRAKADGSLMTMPEGSYKSNWQIACQAERSEFFFNEAAVASGLAGRCIWVPVTIEGDEADAELDDWDYERSYEIEPLQVLLPVWGVNYQNPIFIEPTEALHRELRRARRIGQLGKVNPLESHATRNKARLAAIIAISDNRLEMNDEDVELAEILTQISRRTYQEALKALRAYQNNQNVASGRSDGTRRHYGARRQRELDVQHHAKRIQDKLLELCGLETLTVQNLRQVRNNNFKGETRDEYWVDAIAYLATRSDRPEQLKEISSIEEIRARESDSNRVITKKEVK